MPSECTGRLSGNCCLLHSSIHCQERMSLAGIFQTILKDRAADYMEMSRRLIGKWLEQSAYISLSDSAADLP